MKQRFIRAVTLFIKRGRGFIAQNFKNYVERIAHREKDRRRDAILDILREEEIPFSLRRIKENEHWTENIVISFPPFTRRLALGTHYDNVEGSAAANDNASGVSILIRLAKYLLETGKTNGKNMETMAAAPTFRKPVKGYPFVWGTTIPLIFIMFPISP